MGSHNGRGWVPAASSSIKGPKHKALLHIASSNDIMAFQETHGNVAQLIDLTKPIKKYFYLFWSAVEYDDPVNLSIDNVVIPPIHSDWRSKQLVGSSSGSSSDGESSSTRSGSSKSFCSNDCSQNSSHLSDSESFETESNSSDASPSLAGGV